ncbi:putative bifunctional diguanylate cyclase/phosphodiesterase [Rheinheimera maricola]|uniref:Bifunctional diguanylate cyclase/phosphodiesterase n=1 Tax=Rheinheimera maricola TaxID=2793282 RepID=A0ABS7X6P5_9GAMM|nr:bifunctional diguanylate cyclase/phosphodiesterase [Rheinheimera maricola]MBZ9611215.1 bifunctional diguanylate cyclase/phosphodiesterase [Rheinheimera maricola]
MSYRLLYLVLLSWPLAAQSPQAELPLLSVLSGLLLLCFIYLVKLKVDINKLQKSRQKKQGSQLGFYSLHDDISGFPNKFFLQQQTEQLLKRAPEQRYSLLLLKISQFEQVNQLLGHSNSNLVLAQIAQRINDHLADEELALTFEFRQQKPTRLCHLGAVDFVIWLNCSDKEHAAEYLADALERCIPEPMLMHGCAVEYQLHSGIANYPEHGTQLNELLERAYLALQHHNWVQGASQVFHSDMLHYTNEKLTLMAELRLAITERQLSLYVQPQVDMRNHQVVAAEVYIRWRHPTRGLLSPASFVALAEEMGVIYPLTQWVLNEAVAMIAKLQQADLVSKIAVNISSKDLLHDELIDSLEQLFQRYQVKPQQLMLELKESALLAEPDKARAMLHRLHRLGVELALDDFGTGFSSLAYLRQLPIRHVKVDCSFINELHKSDVSAAVTGAIIDMARNLDLGVIAEGVEEVEVEQKLVRMGCHRGQGFLYSRPFELSGFAIWLKQWQADRAKLQ